MAQNDQESDGEVDTDGSLGRPPVADAPTLRSAVARALAGAGFAPVHVISQDDLRDVTTPKRRELLEVISEAEDLRSVSDLARRIDRDQAAVSRDLRVLSQVGLIELETEGDRKIPRLRDGMVIAEPLVNDGSVAF